MDSIKVLVVDDEKDIRDLIIYTLSKMGLTSVGADNIKCAKEILQTQTIDICLTDMRMPDGDGIQLVKFIQANFEHIPVAVITAYGNMESAITALKAGAFDFVNKPVNIQILRNLINIAKEQIKPVSDRQHQIALLGDSEAITQLKKMALKVAKSQAPVMIVGDSGTGKELVARLIHENSARRDKPFVPVNCGAIPQELMESEFFGYKKGSFTGADKDKRGLFQAADGGTLFLDEIAELPLHLQVKLLRAIQEKSIRQIGAEQEIFVDVRIISATHKNLTKLINAGQFRQDLFYRINVIELQTPKLSAHSVDIPLLAKYFLAKIAKELDCKLPNLADDALQALMQYDFPGNVRELENILSRAATLCENNIITLKDLNLTKIKDVPVDDTQEINLKLDQVQKQLIIDELERQKWNKTKTAEELGITLRALRYRLKKLGIE